MSGNLITPLDFDMEKKEVDFSVNYSRIIRIPARLTVCGGWNRNLRTIESGECS